MIARGMSLLILDIHSNTRRNDRGIAVVSTTRFPEAGSVVGLRSYDGLFGLKNLAECLAELSALQAPMLSTPLKTHVLRTLIHMGAGAQ